MTYNKEGPFRHLPGGESLPACWPECPACAYAAGVKAERERITQKIIDMQFAFPGFANKTVDRIVESIRQEPA